jgi:peptide/nickel transport system permease protein
LTTAALSSRRIVRIDRRWFAVVVGGAVVALIVAVALADNRMDLSARQMPPLTGGYVLGSDQLGRSLLRQICRASLITVVLGGSASLVSVFLGFLLGLGSLSPRRLVRGLMTIVIDLKSGLPTFFVALLLGAIFGQTPLFLFTVLCFVGIEFSARATKDSAADFVDGPMYRALVAEAAPLPRRAAHVFLFVSPVLVPLWALVFLEAILVESGLSFVGLGLKPDLASLGVLIREYYRIILQDGWPIVLATTVLGGFCIGLFHMARRRLG